MNSFMLIYRDVYSWTLEVNACDSLDMLDVVIFVHYIRQSNSFQNGWKCFLLYIFLFIKFIQLQACHLDLLFILLEEGKKNTNLCLVSNFAFIPSFVLNASYTGATLSVPQWLVYLTPAAYASSLTTDFV